MRKLCHYNPVYTNMYSYYNEHREIRTNVCKMSVSMEKYICTLEVNTCEYKGSKGACLIDKAGCGFRIKEEDKKPAQKPKKWFEAYLK